MNKKQAQEYEEKRQVFKSVLKKRLPTIVSVLAMGDETRKMMKEENRCKRIEAAHKRAEKVKR